MPGLPRFVMFLALAAPCAVLPGADVPFDPADLLTPPTSEPAAADEPSQAKQPVPTAEVLKNATDAIKDLYKSEYSTHKGRSALVSTLLDQALQTNDDPGMRYALLNEARELAIVAKNVLVVLEVCDQMAAAYTGDSADELKRTALGRISGVTVVSHLLKLLDAPEDGPANTMVGRWYANDVQQWERALPLLAKGSDHALAEVARAELALTSTAHAAEQTAVADQWYDLGKRTVAVKESFWRHALGLYEQAKPRLSGLSVTIIEKHIAEIEAYLPLGPDIDYNSLSAGQWEKLQGKIITVDGGKGINPTSITVSKEQKIRVVPHPTDTWKVEDRGEILTTTWKGRMAGRRATGSLQCRVGDGIEQSPGVVTGSGKLSLFALTTRGAFDRDAVDRRALARRSADRRVGVSGTIRVKILPVTE